ncbi:FAD-binding monooxygenase ktnD-like [Bradysia coprophila]|uniref:FAD-binding monooxygenase ktnD-like n=1 Tax=Bradysia coprophila TaxID=38358 RepID=UPI00187DBDDA|nr:FAD-binding monooxygenase ktnD-like [Bradysia coprophila]
MSSSNCWSNGVPEIGIVGAGMSGLCAAVQLRKKLAITSFTIFEKNTDVGGTWLNNTYPGCEVDVPGHFYSYSFEPNPNWSVNYPPQREILEYIKGVARKHQIYEHIKFQQEVKTISWNVHLKKWIVRYITAAKSDFETQMFDIIIMALGAFRIPHIPDECKAFTGPTIHTGEWNHGVALKNKKVAVIGSGASAIQVIPSIVDDVQTLHCYQRKPAYIYPRLQFAFPSVLKTFFRYIPLLMWLYRCIVFMRFELFHAAFYSGSLLNKILHAITKNYRRRELNSHKHLWNALTPKYGFGCKRVLTSEQYYAVMTRPNVRLHSSHIDKIVGRTIYTKNGTKQEVDVLVLATGFKVHEYCSPMQIFGKDGQNVLQTWAEKDPRSYYGIVYSSAPNLFSLLGPNTGLSHSSVLFMAECQVDFMINAVREMMRRNAMMINVKVAAEDEFMDKLRADMKNKVWNRENCGSWFANSRGVITTLWGDNCINYWRQTRSIDWSKFEIE